MAWSDLLERCRAGLGDAPLRDELMRLGADPVGPAGAGLRALASLGPHTPEPGMDDLADPVGSLMAVDALDASGDLRCTELTTVGRLMRLGSQSRHLGRLAGRDAQLRQILAEDLEVPRDRDSLIARAFEVAQGCWDEALDSLRGWRRAEVVRAFIRESQGLAPLQVTTSEISAIASACLEVVLTLARAQALAEEGDALDSEGRAIPLVVIGLGKLGGQELNFSSDVDVLFIYETDEGNVGRGDGQWSVHHYFARLAKKVTAAMDTMGRGGRLWRMDLRLRPGGARGPLVHSLAAAEAYYEAWGRTFERAVWIKARPVAGDLELGWEMVERLSPFVYRRHLDRGAFEELRDLKARIDRHATATMSSSLCSQISTARTTAAPATAAVLGWDIKTGHGGIREVEFVAQALQLVWGGRRPEARNRGTLGALEALMAAGLMSAQDADELASAYTFFRLCEHRIQMEGERQTHRMPAKVPELERLSARMGWARADLFMEEVQSQRATVESIFARFFQEECAQGRSYPGALLAVLDTPELRMDDGDLCGALEGLGFDRPRQAAGHLLVLRDCPTSPFASGASLSLARLAPLLLSEVLSSADPDLGLVHLTTFLTRVGAPETYLRALAQNPAALRLLMSLFGSSRYFSQAFFRQPELLDIFVAGRGWAALPCLARGLEEARDAEVLRQSLAASLDGVEEREDRLAALRRFKHLHELRVALGDMAGLLDLEEVGRMLSDLAQTCLEQVLREAWQELVWRHGEPRDEAGACASFTVLALGKLGGAELSYGSDLDLVFVFETGEGETCGLAPIENREFFARLARRMISFLSTRLTEGRLYNVDARLRPSGRQGTLVVGLDAFEAYHRGAASLWERQSLLRGRAVCGVGELSEAVMKVVNGVVEAGPSDARSVCDALAQMRERRVAEVASKNGRVYNIKTGEGGIVDVEYCVQACQLLWGDRPSGLRAPSVFEALRALTGSKVIGAEAQTLLSGYTLLRRLESRLRMLEGTSDSAIPISDGRAMGRLARRAGYRGRDPAAELKRDLERVCAQVRQVYEHVVVDAAPFESEGLS